MLFLVRGSFRAAMLCTLVKGRPRIGGKGYFKSKKTNKLRSTLRSPGPIPEYKSLPEFVDATSDNFIYNDVVSIVTSMKTCHENVGKKNPSYVADLSNQTVETEIDAVFPHELVTRCNKVISKSERIILYCYLMTVYEFWD